MTERERAEQWLLGDVLATLRYSGKEVAERDVLEFDAVALHRAARELAHIAADAIERVLADYRYDLWSTMESWASERSHAANNEHDSVERAAFMGSKYAHSTDATYVRKSDVPWAAAIPKEPS